MRAVWGSAVGSLRICCSLALCLGLAAGAAHAQPAAPAPEATPEAKPAATPDPEGAAVSGLRTTELCIDQAIADRLALKRKRRGAVERLFVKQARHELAVSGGYYSSDLFSSTYIVGGSYGYYMTEETSVELAAAYARANADIIRALEDRRGQAIGDTSDRVMFFESLLMWHPIYGKLRLGGTILHFDLGAGLGVGVVDAETSRGAAGALGLGAKLFVGQALAIRLDLRNRTFYQELLDQRFLVNDSAVTLGVSLFLPTIN